MSDRICVEDGCPNEVGAHGARGRCSPCYHQYIRWFERNGLPVPPPDPKAPTGMRFTSTGELIRATPAEPGEVLCVIEGCPLPRHRKAGRGMCLRHYKEFQREHKEQGKEMPPSPRAARIRKEGRLADTTRRAARAPRYCIDCGEEVEYSGARGRCAACYHQWAKPYKDQGLPLPPLEQNIDARYPPREELLALMAEVGSFNQLARAVGVKRGSLQTFLRTRRDLYFELDALRKPMRGTPRNPDSGKLWHSQALSTTRTRHSGGYFAVDAVARDYVKVLRGDPCSYCGRPTTTIDHIEPLGRGGDDLYTNLTGACHWCNSSKGDRPMLGWMLDTISKRGDRIPTAAMLQAAWAADERLGDETEEELTLFAEEFVPIATKSARARGRRRKEALRTPPPEAMQPVLFLIQGGA